MSTSDETLPTTRRRVDEHSPTRPIDETDVETDEADVEAEVTDADETERRVAEADADDPRRCGLPPEDGSVPDGFPIKGNTNSMKYHEPGGRYYDITIAELYFDTPASAEAAGYEAVASRPPRGETADDATEES